MRQLLKLTRSTSYAQARSSESRAQRHNFFLAGLDQRAHMVRPQRQRGLYFALVGAAIVDSCDADLVTRDMIEHRLDDVRRHTDVGHPGRAGAAQIVQGPLSHLAVETGVEFALGAPLRESETGAFAEQMVASHNAWNRG